MTGTRLISRLRRDEDGATLVELAMVVPLFLLLFFGFIDFSRMAFSYVMAGKATERAARLLVVRPPACDGVPEINVRGTAAGGTASTRYGASCSADPQMCANVDPVICTAAGDNPTAMAVWAAVQPILPPNAGPENLRITYEFTPDMGFLGGPFTPIVTAEITGVNFEFVTPLGGLAGLAGSTTHGALGTDFEFPSMRTSLPGEALYDGVN